MSFTYSYLVESTDSIKHKTEKQCIHSAMIEYAVVPVYKTKINIADKILE